MKRALFLWVVLVFCSVGLAGVAVADFRIVDSNGRLVGFLPDPAQNAFTREMEKGLWVRFPYSSPASIGSLEDGSLSGTNVLLYETTDCTGTPALYELVLATGESVWLSRGVIIGTNPAATQGSVYYGKGGVVVRTFRSSQYWENNTPVCNTFDGGYERRVYSQTVILNASRLGLRQPFKLIQK
jgi:hypothetical protein